MKIKFRKLALLAVLTLAAAGCQKENDVLPLAGTEQTTETIQVVYAINGEVYQISLAESEWEGFVARMLALAREGYEVTFSKNGFSLTSQGKEVVTFVTISEQEANAWAYNMSNEGYTVTITYNKKTKEYTCIAVK